MKEVYKKAQNPMYDISTMYSTIKNDSYVISACNGKVSLFKMMTFKVSHSIYVLQTSSKLGLLKDCHQLL